MASKRIIVTGTQKDAADFALRLQEAGYGAIPLATIRITKKRLSKPSIDALNDIESYDYLLFTSAHAVRFFVDELRERWIKKPHHIRIIAVGPATAHTLAEAGISARLVASRPGLGALSVQLKGIRGKRILFPRSARGSDEAIDALRARGAVVTPIILYATTPIAAPKKTFQKIIGNADCITFMSPSGISGFVKNLGSTILKEQVLSIRAICIGPTTAAAASKAGFRHISIAKPSTTEGIIKTLGRIS